MHRLTDERYVEVNQRLSAINGMGAGLLTLLTFLSLWGEWRIAGIFAVTQVSVILFNTLLVNRTLLRRWGVLRAEIFRSAVNLATGLLMSHMAHWPLPAWFFLPYVALAYDHLGPKVARSVLITLCVAQDTFAIIDGVNWMVPAVFTTFSFFCSAISYVRFAAIRGMLRDADVAHTRLKEEIEARQQVESELRQAQKLEAVGRLAAGIAHEINTPVQFVSDSVHFLRDATDTLFTLMRRFKGLDLPVQARVAIQKAEAELDYPYLVNNVPKAATRSLEGLQRVATIVRSMKLFAHPDKSEMMPTDLGQAIRATAAIARAEYKDVADLKLDIAALPPVVCHVGEINQVMLNLLVNAAHAVSDAVAGTDAKGTISVRAREGDGWVTVELSDSGTGIPDDIAHRVFDPFFTTKEVGRGTGQGLAIAHGVITRHSGTITFGSRPGGGTTFVIRLPVAHAQAA